MSRYWEAFEAAVAVFGRGQVSTYLLAGLGDSADLLLSTSKRLLDIGVYPFVVPFVPIAGTPLEAHPPPTPEFMTSVLAPLGAMVAGAGVSVTRRKRGASTGVPCFNRSSVACW